MSTSTTFAGFRLRLLTDTRWAVQAKESLGRLARATNCADFGGEPMKKLAISFASIACLGLSATPAMAADVSVAGAASVSPAVPTAYDADSDELNHHRRWRHRNRVDVGDVIAGAVIIGGIAAIANAANKSQRDRRYRERDYRYEERRPDYRDQRPDYRDNREIASQGRGMSGAVDMCVEQVERGDDRVEVVDNAARMADGWRVSGSLENGGGFSCWIDNEGRIRNVDLGGGLSDASYGASDYPVQDNQYSDEYYRSARADRDYGG